MPKVNPDLLIWARETAYMTREAAARKLGIGDAYGVDAIQRLADMETGKHPPTRPMLVKMAKQYRRPLLTFYLAVPPKRVERGADFRSLPGDPTPETQAWLDALLRDVRVRQSMVRAVLEDEEEDDALPFIGSGSIQDGKEKILESLQALLGISRSQYREQRDAQTAFALLREKAEEAGVFVLLKGDLGSHHTALDVGCFRGFTIADTVAPFVVINDRDAVTAWSFTLLHELAHLILGHTAISGGHPDNEVERFCNDVAGEFLLSARELDDLELDDDTVLDLAIPRIGEFARVRHLSRSMVAYVAWRQKLIAWEVFESLADRFRRDRLQAREDRRTQARLSPGGPNYYVVRRHRIGPGLIDLVQRMMNAGALTTTKAAKILDVKPKNLSKLFDRSGI